MTPEEFLSRLRRICRTRSDGNPSGITLDTAAANLGVPRATVQHWLYPMKRMDGEVREVIPTKYKMDDLAHKLAVLEKAHSDSLKAQMERLGVK